MPLRDLAKKLSVRTRDLRKTPRRRLLPGREDWNFLLTNRIPRRLATRLMGGFSKLPTGPLPAAFRLRRLFREQFAQHGCSALVLTNVPPAWVLRGAKAPLTANAVAIPSAPRSTDDRSINDRPTNETARGTAEADPAGRH